MKRAFRASAMAVLFGLVFFFSQPSFATQGNLVLPPMKVVVVSGSNYEMGLQYGEQAADLIAVNTNATWNLLDTKVLDSSGNPLGHSVILKDIQVWTYYIEKYDPKLKDWLLGISDGCKNKGFDVTYVDLIALMVLPQELWARPQMQYPSETGVTAFMPGKKSILTAKGRTDTQTLASCTSFAATGSATRGEPMVSLTLGFISDIKLYVILVAYPNDGEPFINLTVAGKVVNNTGMNSKYAWIMTASVTDPTKACASSWGVPSEVYHHYLQQYTKTPNEAMHFLETTPTGGVTGIFLFADPSGDVFAFEIGPCGYAVRKPGDLGERDWVATTNNFNSPKMAPYAIPFDWFSDTYIRYATIFKELSAAAPGTIGLEFAKAAWLSNNWYDATTGTWYTVPVPDDPSDPNVCNVPGNTCEGGESQVVQFPAQKTVYLESGEPQGTSIQYYWPDNPKPTGEYTKWQLDDSIDDTARAASEYALSKIEVASDAFEQEARYLDPKTRSSIKSLIGQARDAWEKGATAEGSAWNTPDKKSRMALWGAACTDYATAQLYAEMASAQLKGTAE